MQPFFSCLLVFLVAIQTRQFCCCLSDRPTALLNLIMNQPARSEMSECRFPVIRVHMQNRKCFVALNHFPRIAPFGRTTGACF